MAAWDEDRLSLRLTAQRCERFAADALLRPGESFTVGARTWQAHAAPGRDPHSLVLFDAQGGVLIPADARWENSFGVVFPELDGLAAVDDAAATLALIESFGARLVIPGHGAPFSDVAGALQRARSRLAASHADPARHGIKALCKCHLLEVGSQPLPQRREWFETTPIAPHVWRRLGRPGGSPAAWGEGLLVELAAGGAVVLRDGVAFNT